MLPFGHTAVGYLISQTAKSKLTKTETWAVVAAANIFDLDFFVLTALGQTGGLHHYFPGHTPLAGVIYWLIYYLFFKSQFSRKAFIFIGLALLSHLVVDDFSHWLSLLGLEQNVPSQINWFYPLTQKELMVGQMTNFDVLKIYLLEAPKLFYLETIVVVSSLVVYFRHHTSKV